MKKIKFLFCIFVLEVIGCTQPKPQISLAAEHLDTNINNLKFEINETKKILRTIRSVNDSDISGSTISPQR